MSGTTLDDLKDPNYFYNHGDNPALKNYYELLRQNTQGGTDGEAKTIHQLGFHKFQKLYLARDWQDVFVRDWKVDTTPRALLLAFFAFQFNARVIRHTNRCLPFYEPGKFSLARTPFFRAFGWIGVTGLVVSNLFTFNLAYESVKHFFRMGYKRVILGDKNWMRENLEYEPGSSQFHFSDSHYIQNDTAGHSALQKALKKDIIPLPNNARPE